MILYRVTRSYLDLFRLQGITLAREISSDAYPWFTRTVQPLFRFSLGKREKERYGYLRHETKAFHVEPWHFSAPQANDTLSRAFWRSEKRNATTVRPGRCFPRTGVDFLQSIRLSSLPEFLCYVLRRAFLTFQRKRVSFDFRRPYTIASVSTVTAVYLLKPTRNTPCFSV